MFTEMLFILDEISYVTNIYRYTIYLLRLERPLLIVMNKSLPIVATASHLYLMLYKVIEIKINRQE